MFSFKKDNNLSDALGPDDSTTSSLGFLPIVLLYLSFKEMQVNYLNAGAVLPLEFILFGPRPYTENCLKHI